MLTIKRHTKRLPSYIGKIGQKVHSNQGIGRVRRSAQQSPPRHQRPADAPRRVSYNAGVVCRHTRRTRLRSRVGIRSPILAQAPANRQQGHAQYRFNRGFRFAIPAAAPKSLPASGVPMPRKRAFSRSTNLTTCNCFPPRAGCICLPDNTRHAWQIISSSRVQAGPERAFSSDISMPWD